MFDGKLIINDSITIGPGYTLEEYKKSSLYNESQNISIFFWIRNTDCYINGEKFIVGLYFDNNGKLSNVKLYPNGASFSNEKEKKEFNDEFVKKLTMNQNHFYWGTIDSFMSMRENVALIIMWYKQI